MEEPVPLQIAAPALVDGLGALAVKVCDNEHVVYEDVACIFYIPVSINQLLYRIGMEGVGVGSTQLYNSIWNSVPP